MPGRDGEQKPFAVPGDSPRGIDSRDLAQGSRSANHHTAIGGEGALDKPLHIAIAAKDRATVDAFYQAALAAGAKDNGAPGLRPHYHANYYGAFVRDPDGHNIEAVCHAPA